MFPERMTSSARGNPVIYAHHRGSRDEASVVAGSLVRVLRSPRLVAV